MTPIPDKARIAVLLICFIREEFYNSTANLLRGVIPARPLIRPVISYRQQQGGEVLISRILRQRMLPGEQAIDDTEG